MVILEEEVVGSWFVVVVLAKRAKMNTRRERHPEKEREPPINLQQSRAVLVMNNTSKLDTIFLVRRWILVSSRHRNCQI